MPCLGVKSLHIYEDAVPAGDDTMRAKTGYSIKSQKVCVERRSGWMG